MRTHLRSSLHRFDIRHLGALPSLASNRLIGFAASNIIGMFFAIFLYEFFNMQLHWVLIWYIICYAIRIPLFIWAAKLFSKIGLTTSMMIASVIWVGFYLTLYQMGRAPEVYPLFFLTLAMLLLAVLTVMYWAPFHVDFAKFSKKGKRGKQVSSFYALNQILQVTVPIIGAYLISTYSYEVAFLVGIVLVFASMVPLMYIPQTRVTYEFGFFETFKKMVEPKYRWLTVSMMAHGAESVVSTLIWPIFLFIVLKGDYLDVGLFAAAIVVVNILLQLGIGRALDKRPRKKLLKWGVDLYAVGWFGKALVDSVGGVFAASTFHSFGSIMMKTPLDTMMYEKAADAGHYIDEFTTIREIALVLGRTIMLSVVLLITTWLPITSAFVLAALVSFSIVLFAKVSGKEPVV